MKQEKRAKRHRPIHQTFVKSVRLNGYTVRQLRLANAEIIRLIGFGVSDTRLIEMMLVEGLAAFARREGILFRLEPRTASQEGGDP